MKQNNYVRQKKYWDSFVHNGVCFPPPYDYKGLEIIVHGKRYKLSPVAEEMAWAWVKIMNTEKVKDEVFRSNFMKDFSKHLPKEIRNVDISQIDFSEVRKAYLKEKIRLKRNKKLSKQRKKEKEKLRKMYGFAYVDGRKVRISNWMVEPPGIFMGRGNHPLRGRWKPRIEPRDVTLNLSKDAKIPEGDWGEVVHDPSGMWVARWKDKLTGKIKYVWLHETSHIRQHKDKEKYDKALKLAKKIQVVRKRILKALRSRDFETRKIATACYLIDKLGLRVGDEKDPDEADTVGATTLRVEHVKITERAIEFKFLGKDSVEWHKSIKLDDADPHFVKNMLELIRGKKQGEQIFDTVSSTSVNKFLSKCAKGLTAKVFRTYHATRVVWEYLLNSDGKTKRANLETKKYIAKLANLEAAKFCNHKRTTPKSYRSSVKKKLEKLRELLEKKPKSKKAERKVKQRIKKLKLEIELLKKTKDYNLATSLKNYIDPRVYKAWAEHVGIDWHELYPKSLQKKFAWVSKAKVSWENFPLNHVEKQALKNSL
ncbi:hypothetical protein B9Q13_04970 [Candidatus Marsarchaeota G2 archaeon ECH_B_SAG-G16]|jgi:DNA topoisomerase-1|uniref:DNA topoisomerase 1 n=3 Tax=Candidatus Marsarchaeota TaxID=1978152 RepID=A0A2R6AEG9_9ARCH|nr:MAG: hypothetical protein B9Q01_03475 [Candidatus Marsarchaeota G1 archaeon OSP_D]PSN84728.1 MAG: hypothetical protein B9Q02_09055 [Candidatus Marsarchaeota G1 archaeon BE_D]PSO04315.1 MAG: hypothetical protein B9Q13_04970 [Candidatus Marsarchaeota G2 archaeon ECH_B_SAG-G16]